MSHVKSVQTNRAIKINDKVFEFQTVIPGSSIRMVCPDGRMCYAKINKDFTGHILHRDDQGKIQSEPFNLNQEN